MGNTDVRFLPKFPLATPGRLSGQQSEYPYCYFGRKKVGPHNKRFTFLLSYTLLVLPAHRVAYLMEITMPACDKDICGPNLLEASRFPLWLHVLHAHDFVITTFTCGRVAATS